MGQSGSNILRRVIGPCRIQRNQDTSHLNSSSTCSVSIYPEMADENDEQQGESNRTILRNRVHRVVSDGNKVLRKKVAARRRKSSAGITSEEEDSIRTSLLSYRVKGINELLQCTKFSREELQRMYRGFKNDCPSGVVDKETFLRIYAQFFPNGDSAQYAQYIFNTFDTNRDGKITFEEFAVGLSTSLHGSLEDKLRWTFRLYDLDNDGVVSRKELMEVVEAVHRMLAPTPNPPETPTPVTYHESSMVEEHVARLFQAMDTNHDGVITEEEFLEACINDQRISYNLAVFNDMPFMPNNQQDTNQWSGSPGHSHSSAMGRTSSSPVTPCRHCQNRGGEIAVRDNMEDRSPHTSYRISRPVNQGYA